MNDTVPLLDQKIRCDYITEFKKGGNTIYEETFDEAGRVKTHTEYTDNKIVTS